MTLDFKQKELAQERKFYTLFEGNPYIGYFSPKGKLINFNLLFGFPGHDNWRNKASYAFINYISYLLEDKLLQDYSWMNEKSYKKFIHNNAYLGRDNIVIRGMNMHFDSNDKDFESFMKDLESEIEIYKKQCYDPYCKLAYDILKLFKLAYKNQTFFETLGKEISVLNWDVFIKNNKLENTDFRTKEILYSRYLKKELMSYFKDFCVLYLGYDSLERIKPNGEYLELPDKKDDSYVLETPRLITTSSLTPNERFYNYLLMGWSVHRLPRYIYNEREQKFEKEPNIMQFFNNEKEESLEEEIQSIKKLVPLKERHKYFR